MAGMTEGLEVVTERLADATGFLEGATEQLASVTN